MVATSRQHVALVDDVGSDAGEGVAGWAGTPHRAPTCRDGGRGHAAGRRRAVRPELASTLGYLVFVRSSCVTDGSGSPATQSLEGVAEAGNSSSRGLRVACPWGGEHTLCGRRHARHRRVSSGGERRAMGVESPLHPRPRRASSSNCLQNSHLAGRGWLAELVQGREERSCSQLRRTHIQLLRGPRQPSRPVLPDHRTMALQVAAAALTSRKLHTPGRRNCGQLALARAGAIAAC